jgi:hypothetical protein
MCASVYAKDTEPMKSGQIKIAYVSPPNPGHQAIYELMKDRRVLERMQEYLSPLRLPRPLLLKLDGCDGEANAWYEEEDTAVTVCYEYIDAVLHNAPKETTPAGVTRDDAIVGPGVEVFLHEIGHAVFNLLQVPILGREEDAADQFADYLILHMDKDEQRKVVGGIAYMYAREAQDKSVKMKQFADVHGTSGQRLYNLMCLAYGSDAAGFADVVEKKYLPESRAEGCGDEYKQVDYAMRKLIVPSFDQAKIKTGTRRKLLKPEAAPAVVPEAK